MAPTASSTRAAAASTKKRKKKKSRKKPLPVCTKKDLKKPKRKRRKCRVVKKPAKKPSPTGPITAPPVTTPNPDAFPTPSVVEPVDGLRTYSGPFGPEQAQRLLLRAGFGPRPGEADAVAALGLRATVDRLLNPPGGPRLEGPAPTGSYLVGGEFAPADRYGHMHLQFLDRMVRSTDQLGERMTLVLHDWFAVSDSGVERRWVHQHLALLRGGWRGSLRQLLLDVTTDPGMLLFLDGVHNRRGAPNENYGRELMELYALGADRGAYTEDDVRELARALTGFRSDWTEALGSHNFRFDRTRFDDGVKTLFAGTAHERQGRLDWRDAVHAVVDHPLHASFVVLKLWSYFIPTAPSPVTQAQLEALYRSSGERLAPLVEAILLHPDLYRGPAMTTPPVVHAARMLRATGRGLASDAWTRRLADSGQLLGAPPNVAGWNDRAWLNTSSHGARWGMVQEIVRTGAAVNADYTGRTETPAEALDRAIAFWGRPLLNAGHRAALERVAAQTWERWTGPGDYGSLDAFLANRQNVLRQMVAAAPDFQVS